MANSVLDWFFRVWLELFGVSPTSLSSESLSCSVAWNTTKGGVWYMGSPAHRQWQNDKLANAPDVWSRLFKEVSRNEGSSSAYQNYDNQKVTLGAGFGARGMLGSLARTLGRPDVIPLPDNGNKYSDSLIGSMSDYQGYGRSYVCKAESVALRDDVLSAQVSTFKNSKLRYGFDTSNFPVLYLVSHLAHWYPAFIPVGGWTGKDSVDVPRALTEFRATAANWKTSPSETQIASYVKHYRKLGGTYEV